MPAFRVLWFSFTGMMISTVDSTVGSLTLNDLLLFLQLLP